MRRTLVGGFVVLTIACSLLSAAQKKTLRDEVREKGAAKVKLWHDIPRLGPHSTARLVEMSDAVIAGEVTSESVRLSKDETTILTDYTITVTAVLKDSKKTIRAGDRLVVSTFGGSLMLEAKPAVVIDTSFAPIPWHTPGIFFVRHARTPVQPWESSFTFGEFGAWLFQDKKFSCRTENHKKVGFTSHWCGRNWEEIEAQLKALVSGTPNSQVQEERFAKAQNKWMLQPTDVVNATDPISPDTRALRDAYWDNVAGSRDTLSQPQQSTHVVLPGPTLASSPEFPSFNDAVWMIADFESHRAILSASERSIYTELQLSIKLVLHDNSNAGLQAGTLITLARPGGTIIAPWGPVISQNVFPQLYDLQPGRNYLILLRHHAEGDFYTSLERAWDVTSGIVQPATLGEVARHRRNQSTISGHKLDKAVEILLKAVAARSGTPSS